jgi:poly(3-hydroxybutyrate) depolymerase
MRAIGPTIGLESHSPIADTEKDTNSPARGVPWATACIGRILNDGKVVMSHKVSFLSSRWCRGAALGGLALLFVLGCGSTDPGGTTGTGGSGSGGSTGVGGSGSGGTKAAGGAVGSGGLVGSGGALGTGGKAGTGGSVGSGGKSGSGGTVSTGGADDGGATGNGGSTGAGGTKARDGGLGGGGSTSSTGGTSAGGSTGGLDGGPGGAVSSAGCGKTPTLKNSPSNNSFTQNTVTVSGKSRQFIIRWPDNYDNKTPYRLILGLHGATGKGADVAGASSSEGPYFGLWDLSKGSTIFIAPSADGGLWDATSDTAFVTEILKVVEADLCIDTSRIMLEGFSQGAAMSWTLACGMQGVFRAAVGHSGGGVANPKSCQAVAYFGSGGKQENVTQTTQSDQFAKWNGCTAESFAAAPSGGHACNDYKGCSAGHPVRWCPYDGPHTPSPTDSGTSKSWMPAEVWPFVSQF